MERRDVVWGMLMGFFVVQGTLADTVALQPAKDNTLYESPNGSRSNGAGEHVFAGRNSQPANSRRRAVISFDISGNVPAGSVIEGVTLTMQASQTASASANIAVHRLTAAWGEGPSDAGSPGGGGAPAMTGDATWMHTFFDSDFWATAGGDFNATPSGSTLVAGTGSHSWSSTQSMVADVQTWLDTAAGNFGWVLIGDETAGGSAVRFFSRESGMPGNRPTLTVEFTPPAQAVPGVSAWGLIVLTLALLTVAKVVFWRRPPQTRPG